MRILMVAPEQLPVPSGGSVEICMLSIARELARKHQVVIVSRDSPMLPRITKEGNLTIRRLPAASPEIYQEAVLQEIRGRRLDVVQVDNRPMLMAAVKKAFPRMPVALFLHSLTFVPRTKSVRRSVRAADLLIVNSHSLKKELAARFLRQARRIHVVHLGVDPGRFKPRKEGRTAVASARARSSCRRTAGTGRGLTARTGTSGVRRAGACADHTRFRVLFAGRVIPRKGVPVLIRAVGLLRKRHPGARLTVVGQGKAAYEGRLKQLAKDCHVPIVFTGRISHTRIHREYAKADCLVCPSQEHEAFGLVNVEAMASGLPVVASDIGGIGEIVRHGVNGYLVKDYQDPEAFADYLDRLAADPRRAARLGRRGRRDVLERFSWRQTAKRLARIYAEAASRPV